MRDESDARDLIFAPADSEDRKAATVQAHQRPCHVCAGQLAGGHEEPGNARDVKGNRAQLGGPRGRQVVRRLRQVGTRRRYRIDWFRRQRNLKGHMGQVEQRSVRRSRRGGQERIAIWQAPTFPQSLRSQVHEPSGIIRPTGQRDADVGGEQRDSQYCQGAQRKVRYPCLRWLACHSARGSHQEHQTDREDGDEDPVEKVQVRGQPDDRKETHHVEEQQARGKQQEHVDVACACNVPKVPGDEEDHRERNADGESLRRHDVVDECLAGTLTPVLREGPDALRCALARWQALERGRVDLEKPLLLLRSARAPARDEQRRDGEAPHRVPHNVGA
jgi:hypothetical protein